MSSTPSEKQTHYRVSEIFGPTIQGEGPLAGKPCHFVRLGGCDYRCSWCDSMHAVDPVQILKGRKMTSAQIVEEVSSLSGNPRWVILTGGNPAVQKVGPLILGLQQAGFLVQMETQGSLWRNELTPLDLVVLSPKPPSSSMEVPLNNLGDLEKFLGGFPPEKIALKVVIFDQEDIDYTKELFSIIKTRYPLINRYFLSVGTPQTGTDKSETRNLIGDNGARLATLVTSTKEFQDVALLPQIHAIFWGSEKGR